MKSIDFVKNLLKFTLDFGVTFGAKLKKKTCKQMRGIKTSENCRRFLIEIIFLWLSLLFLLPQPHQSITSINALLLDFLNG